MKKIQFAVAGCGHIGKRHADMILRDEGAQLVALCDILPREALGIEAFEAPFFTNFADMLSAAFPIDVVNICTPNGLHASMAIRALEAGYHVVIEKPMALTRTDAEKVVYTALKHRKQAFCVMQNRYSPPSLWIKEMITSGRLGDIYMAQFNCYWNRDERYYKPGGWHGDAALDGGTLFTQFSHFVDIMYWLFGDIADIQARFADFNHAGLTAFEDSGIINFRFVNGGIGSLCYSTSVWDKNMESSMLIIAQNGSIKIGGQYMDKVAYCHVKDYTLPQLLPTNPGNDYGAYKGSAQNHHYVIRNVVNVLSGSSSEPITTNVLEGLKVVDIIRRIYQTRQNCAGEGSL
ncbi:MAG: Gfo/Idh/MocA family oxidoreductase [Tannerellaceae bacterium]|jgi:predicted dehydrogenase|nr:Gfo/Idh/MocA family oxidoreductase [Tannerellaceae bacterium]